MGLYRSVGRPFFFALPPEASHRLAGRLLRSPLPWSSIGGAIDSPALGTNLAGIKLRNPIGMAAGFDKDCRLFGSLGELGFGYIVGGTLTRRPREGNPKPRIVRIEQTRSLVNSMGLPNPGVEVVALRLAKTRKTAPVLVSLADEDVDDLVFCRDTIQPLVDGIELNVSSPNSPWRHDRADNGGYLTQALAALAPGKGVPIFVKLPPGGDAPELARIAADGGADGLTCSNTRPVDEPRLAKGSGGLSGPELLDGTLRAVESIGRATPLPVNACGGVWTAEDARRCLDAGATTVQLYTALIYEGPRLLRSLTSGLAAAFARSGRGTED